MEHPDYARYVLCVELLSTLSMLLYSAQTVCKTDLVVRHSPSYIQALPRSP